MAAQNIPLRCTICPKKPWFSDVSHLLTHIASKGHLSHYYKIKVRSSTEETSRQLVEAYDQWYAHWNVEDLMSERMSQKEKRRARGKGFSSNKSNTTTPAPTNNAQLARSKSARLIDPDLSEQSVKHEARLTPPSYFGQSPQLPDRQQSMQLWPSFAPFSYRQPNGCFLDSAPQHPFDQRDIAYAQKPDPVLICSNEDNEDLAPSDCTKLKGVYWPGMDIFDSATPEMKRKRNQKKDTSVVEQLEINSLEVEPNELIFTPLGSFKRQRRISGSIHDSSSPIKNETAFVKPSRAVLESLDPNRPRYDKSHRPSHQEDLSFGFSNQEDPLLESLSHTKQAQKRKRTFDVFREHEISLNNPAAFNYLTSEFHYLPPAQSPHVDFRSCTETAVNFEPQDALTASTNHTPSDNLGHLTFPPFQHSYGQESQSVFSHPFYFGSFQAHHEEVDDHRTLTAPSSDN